MHSFQPSRGRILFEVLCAFAVVASMVGAWRQTHASSLLVAAVVAGLYGFVRLFDMPEGKKAQAVEPQRIDFEPETADVVVPMVAVEELQPALDSAVDEAESGEAEVARTGSGRRSGGSRKGSGRRAKAPKAAKAAEPAPVEESDVPWPMAAEAPQPEAIEPALTADDDEFDFLPEEEEARSHIEPLFEPEPFARMPRRAFGRRGRI